MSADTIEARVARGVALLDAKLPGWVDRIDLDLIALESCSRCVLGQLFADTVPFEDGYYEGNAYVFGLGYLFGGAGALEEAGDDYAYDHGFNGDSNALTAEWRRVVLARRAGAR